MSAYNDLALKIDTALKLVEKTNKSLQGALPDNYFSRLDLDRSDLASLVDKISEIDTLQDAELDIIGRVYEYFLGKFAASEGKGGGEFYTPKCVVNLIAELIEPYKGKIYDPCCGSGGMFVQCLKFIKEHQGNTRDISIYGQEKTSTTYKLAKMNLAIRGISADLGKRATDTFSSDQHSELKADFVMANPPFNQKDWRGADELTDDPRWSGYNTPPTSNANYAWILHIASKLSHKGKACFVLANSSLTPRTNDEVSIFRRLLETNQVSAIVALPTHLFYNMFSPVCLWVLDNNKKTEEIIFIDASQHGIFTERKRREISEDEVEKISSTYKSWNNSKKLTPSVPCGLAQNSEVIKNLTLLPQRYITKSSSSSATSKEEFMFELESSRKSLKRLIKQSAETLSYLNKIAPLAQEVEPTTAPITESIDTFSRHFQKLSEAIFRDAFIDFGPTRRRLLNADKLIGESIEKLFPDELQETDYGVIPKGWIVYKLGEIIERRNEKVGEIKNIVEFSATVRGLERRDTRYKKTYLRTYQKIK